MRPDYESLNLGSNGDPLAHGAGHGGSLQEGIARRELDLNNPLTSRIGMFTAGEGTSGTAVYSRVRNGVNAAEKTSSRSARRWSVWLSQPAHLEFITE